MSARDLDIDLKTASERMTGAWELVHRDHAGASYEEKIQLLSALMRSIDSIKLTDEVRDVALELERVAKSISDIEYATRSMG